MTIDQFIKYGEIRILLLQKEADIVTCTKNNILNYLTKKKVYSNIKEAVAKVYCLGQEQTNLDISNFKNSAEKHFAAIKEDDILNISISALLRNFNTALLKISKEASLLDQIKMTENWFEYD